MKIVLPSTESSIFAPFQSARCQSRHIAQTFAKIVLLFKLQGASEVFGAPSLQIPADLYIAPVAGVVIEMGTRMPVPNLLHRARAKTTVRS